jgi:hypothetical protein
MANATICLYGSTSTYKTTQIGFLARYLFEKTHKPLRLVSADTGGGWRSIQNYVDAGLIVPFSIRNEPSPIYILHKLVQGYWPLDLEDGVRKSGRFSIDYSNVSSYAFEGLTSISDMIMNHIAGKKLSQDSAYKLTLDSMGGETISAGEKSEKYNLSSDKLVNEKGLPLTQEVVGTAAMAHYGFIQDKVPEIMEKSWDLPVEIVIWTAHEAVGEDAVSGKIRGPALVGKKGTAKIGRKVGMMIHADSISNTKPGVVKEAETTQVRYYFISHPDTNNPLLTWPAKPRVDSEIIPELLKKFPGGYFCPSTKYGSGIDYYLKIEAELSSKGSDDLKKWRDNILKGDK